MILFLFIGLSHGGLVQNLVVEQEGDQALCFCCFMSLCYCVSIYCVFFLHWTIFLSSLYLYFFVDLSLKLRQGGPVQIPVVE